MIRALACLFLAALAGAQALPRCHWINGECKLMSSDLLEGSAFVDWRPRFSELLPLVEPLPPPKRRHRPNPLIYTNIKENY